MTLPEGNKRKDPRSGSVTVKAPGRINLIGDHTDYHDGFVLPGAVVKSVAVEMLRKESSEKVRLTAADLEESYSFDLRDYHPTEQGWPNYIMGVVHELQKLGAEISGFEATFSSTVPMGAGMSSSAALECSFAVALNELFQLGFDQRTLIEAAQRAEHNFVGMKCGIMDQFASMMGQQDQVMLLDCRSLAYEYVPCSLGDYQLLLLNSNVTHSLASSDYNTRREESEEGIRWLKKKFPGIKNLRDLSLEALLGVRYEMPELLFRRCHHVISENGRVLAATQALQEEDFERLGELMYQSHFSLQDGCETSCPELDFLVAQTLDNPYVLGSRIMGGGFGGCAINLVVKNQVESVVEEIAKAYRDQFGIDLSPIEVAIGDGARVIHKS